MDKSNIIEQWQQAELVRKNKIRRLARSIPCQECGSAENQPCIRQNGRLRVHNHMTRYEDAKNKGLIDKTLLVRTPCPI